MESVAYIPASWRVYWIKPLLFSLLILLTQSACPNNPEPLECGENQIEVNGTCECAEGYHWNEDQTQCKMDTTSHDFMWEIDTLGDYGSYLNDVAIIDENNIWVVGYIKTADSTYNAAHWDGSEWDLERLPAVAYGGYISQGALTSIHLINSENIWCSSDAGSYVHWNGESWQSEWIPDRGGGIKAIWGTSSSNLYFVGTNGSIVHYDGTEFTKMESGTEVALKDIYGTGENVIITGYEDEGEYGGHSIALHIYDNEIETIRQEDHFYPNAGTDEFGLISSVWVYDEIAYIMTYSGIRRYNICNYDKYLWISRKEMGDASFHIVSVKGNKPNDIMFSDRWSYIIHYNGLTFKTFTDLYDIYPNGQLVTINMDFKEDLMVSVGTLHGPENAVIIMGHRQ